MGFRVAAAMLVVAALVWSACDEAPTEQQHPDATVLTAKVVQDALCETKDLPAKDYFSKANVKAASTYLRDLTDDCLASNPVSAWPTGFSILQLAAGESGDPVLGGEIVAGVWSVMAHAEAKGRLAGAAACEDCDLSPIAASSAATALDYGVMEFRGGADTAPVVYPGGSVWGIEPDAPGGTWGVAVPYGMAMVLGFPIGDGPLDEDPLENALIEGFNWDVVPWWKNPDNDTPALAVGSCDQPLDTKRALISHVYGGTERLLPPGKEPGYCAQYAAADGWGQRFGRLAAAVVPLWPRELNATLLAGKSGSGKARELSPFYGYSVHPYAKTYMGTPAATTRPGQPICFYGFDDPDGDQNPTGCVFAFDWTTEVGNEPASLETLLVTVRENNGATVELNFTDDGGASCVVGPEGYGAHQILCECDNRELAANRCDRLELTELRINKTGGYQLCVTSVPGVDPSTLIIEDCTESFHIKPNAP